MKLQATVTFLLLHQYITLPFNAVSPQSFIIVLLFSIFLILFINIIQLIKSKLINLHFYSISSNKVRLLKLTSIDDYSGSANSLSFGVFDSLGYVTINIEGWIFIQFKIDASKSIFIRGRYGANGWGPFVKLWA